MRIGVGLDARLGLAWDDLLAMARAAERLGFESVWTPAGGVPDAFHVTAAWCEETSLRAGISVVPAARMWSPLSLAAQAATVAMRSSGRFVLGIGTGGSGPAFWQSLGLANRPIAHMRDYTVAVKDLLAGRTVTSTGPMVHLRDASLGLLDPLPTPVYLAALGDQMLALAGEVADGALLNWATPERIAASRQAIAEGARRAGRQPDVVPVTMYVRVCIDDDVAAARRAFGEQVLGYALAQPGLPHAAGYRALFATMGFDAVLSALEERRDWGASTAELLEQHPTSCFAPSATSVPPRGPRPRSRSSASDSTRRSCGSSRLARDRRQSMRPWQR